MYLIDNQIERTALRQGDLISQVHIFGAINFRAISYDESPNGSPGWSVDGKPRINDAMVISHSCEIDKRNEPTKFTSIILAPVRKASSATRKDKLQDLIDSNIVDAESSTHSYLKYFYLESNEELEFDSGAVVDFSKCFSVSKRVYDDLLQKKVAQLTPQVVERMALKLGAYFYRTKIEAA